MHQHAFFHVCVSVSLDARAHLRRPTLAFHFVSRAVPLLWFRGFYDDWPAVRFLCTSRFRGHASYRPPSTQYTCTTTAWSRFTLSQRLIYCAAELCEYLEPSGRSRPILLDEIFGWLSLSYIDRIVECDIGGPSFLWVESSVNGFDQSLYDEFEPCIRRSRLYRVVIYSRICCRRIPEIRKHMAIISKFLHTAYLGQMLRVFMDNNHTSWSPGAHRLWSNFCDIRSHWTHMPMFLIVIFILMNSTQTN